jgi:hypothetical protein
MATRILIFAKAPVPGQVKTRLIPALGEEGAARLAQRMLLDTWQAASQVAGAEAELCLAPEHDHPDWAGRLPPRARRWSAQGEGDLVARLSRAAERVLGSGDKVIFIGTDCPDLGPERLAAACRALETHDAVMLPAEDGGYVLLGLARYHPLIFSGILMGGADVARETAERVKALGWSLQVGDTLRDIDEPEDLAFFEAAR